jgi:EpsI family protein
VSWWRTGLACGLLLASAILLHALSHGEPVPIRAPLDSFPKALGLWTGEDLPIDARVDNALRADARLLRQYVAPQRGPIWLFIAYYKSQRLGETVHSPRSCLPGAGWEPISGRRESVLVAPGRPIVSNRFLVQKGIDRQLVFYWYQSHGRAVASEYRAKAYLVADAIHLNRTDGALIRISVPLLGKEADGEKSAQEFIYEMYPLLARYIPE